MLYPFDGIAESLAVLNCRGDIAAAKEALAYAIFDEILYEDEEDEDDVQQV